MPSCKYAHEHSLEIWTMYMGDLAGEPVRARMKAASITLILLLSQTLGCLEKKITPRLSRDQKSLLQQDKALNKQYLELSEKIKQAASNAAEMIQLESERELLKSRIQRLRILAKAANEKNKQMAIPLPEIPNPNTANTKSGE